MATKLIVFCIFWHVLSSVSAQDRSHLSIASIKNDSVTAVASTAYEPNSFLRRWLMGNNYRDVWKEPVTLPVFQFSGSGFRIKEMGGGMQTKSLHIIDSTGKEWSLRTVNKDVSAALPKGVRRTLIYKASQDFISASFPYGAPIAGALVNAVGIPAARPQIVFVAEDSAFGEFRSIFSNSICMLEERDPGFDSTDNIFTAAERLQQSNQYKAHQPMMLKARLMDVLMADWDRHADNWRWGLKDSAGLKFYYAIPRDRDWVFYQSNGLVPKLVKMSGGMRCFVNFSKDLKNIKNLSWKAWTLDKNSLNEMDAADWESAINEIQTLLTDSVITAAVRKMPGAVYNDYGEKFIHTLKGRRDELKEEVMKYYRFLSEEVIINGSNEDELFSVSSAGDSLQVVVYAINNGKQKIYERSFSPSETYFIKLNGLAGNDAFEIDERAKSKIRIIINGGDGEDRYSIQGKVRIKINDNTASNKAEENFDQANVRLN